MTGYHRVRLIIRLALFLSAPILFSWFVFYFAELGGASSQSPRWMSTARMGLAAVVVLFTSMPFLLAHIFTGVGSLHVRRRNRDPDELALSMAVVYGGLSPMLAFMLFVAGGHALDVYLTSTLSVASHLFWLRRFRHVVRRVRGST